MKKVYLFLLFGLLLFSSKLLAADYYWVGKASNINYNSLQNWALGSVNGATPTVIPGASDNLFFTDGATGYNVNFNGLSIVFNNLTVTATNNSYTLNMTGNSGVNKTITINGILNVTDKVVFKGGNGGINDVGALVLKNTPILTNNNVFQIYLVFNSGTNISINSNITAHSIKVENGTKLDISNRNINLETFGNSSSRSGNLIISNSSSSIDMTNTTLSCHGILIEDINIANSSFVNSTIKFIDGAFPVSSGTISATSLTSNRGLLILPDNIELNRVEIKNFTSAALNKAFIFNLETLKINELIIEDTDVVFYTNNLDVENLIIDRNHTYYLLGSSSIGSSSQYNNLDIENLVINPLSNGVLRFKSYFENDSKMAKIKFPNQNNNYENIVASNIYSNFPVTFINSILENSNFNICVNNNNNSVSNFYWSGNGDGETWEDLNNWSSNENSQNNVTRLPSLFDNVVFNNNSRVNAIIKVNTPVDVLDFKVESSFLSKTTILESKTHNFTIRGNTLLQSGFTFKSYITIFSPLVNNSDCSNNNNIQPKYLNQNGGIMLGLDNAVSKIILTGGGTLNIIGDSFKYHDFTNTRDHIFEFKNGSLNFNVNRVELVKFDGSIETDSKFKLNLTLNNAEIYVKSWSYNNSNDTNINGKFNLNAGNSKIYFYYTFEGGNDNQKYTIQNKLMYNEIYSAQGLANSKNTISGIFDTNKLILNKNSDFTILNSGVFGNNTTRYYVNINVLELKSGIDVNFSRSYNINLKDKLITNNIGNCQLVTNILNPSNTVYFKVDLGVMDESLTPNNLTFKNYYIEGVTFQKVDNYQIRVIGGVDSRTSTNITLVEPLAQDLYWIGSNSNDNYWHNEINWVKQDSSFSCAPTRFDNAHFNNVSNQFSNDVRVKDNVFIKNIIFESNSPQNMKFLGEGNLSFNMLGSLILNNTIFESISKINFIGSNDIDNYDNDPSNRHKIINNNSTYNRVLLVFEKEAYYKIVDDFNKTNNYTSGIQMQTLADVDAKNIILNLSDFATNTSVSPNIAARGKIDFSNSTLNIDYSFNSNYAFFLLIAKNTKFNFTSNGNLTFRYNGLPESLGNYSNFDGAEINVLKAASTFTFTGPSNSPLKFKSIVLRGNNSIFETDFETNILNFLSNTIRITAQKEFKVNTDAYLSGSACERTKSIVSSVAGTRAKFTVLSGDTNFDYLTLKDIDAENSYQNLVFGVYSTNSGNNSAKVIFLDATNTPSTFGFDAVYACRDITIDNMLSADGFYPNSLTTFEWYKVDGNTKTLIAQTKDLDVNIAGLGYGTYELKINYDPTTVGACVIVDTITISPFPTSPTELADDKFCKNKIAKLSDIFLDGYDLVWYTSATSTTPIDPSTAIVSGNTYYVARKNQSTSGLVCESTDRLALVLKLDACGGVYINPVLRMRSL